VGPYLKKNLSQKGGGRWAGGVAQGVGPEFKPQYRKTKKQKKKRKEKNPGPIVWFSGDYNNSYDH
jgi:hypothetical protein